MKACDVAIVEAEANRLLESYNGQPLQFVLSVLITSLAGVAVSHDIPLSDLLKNVEGAWQASWKRVAS